MDIKKGDEVKIIGLDLLYSSFRSPAVVPCQEVFEDLVNKVFKKEDWVCLKAERKGSIVILEKGLGHLEEIKKVIKDRKDTADRYISACMLIKGDRVFLVLRSMGSCSLFFPNDKAVLSRLLENARRFKTMLEQKLQPFYLSFYRYGFNFIQIPQYRSSA